MEQDTDFDYAGNPFRGNRYSNYNLLTPSIFNASDVDFSNMPNFTPPIGNPEMAMLNITSGLRLTGSNFLGDYVSGSEVPFPAIPANTYTLPLAVASTMAPSDLSMPPDSNFPAHGLPRPVPQQDQSEPQSASLQAKQGTGRQEPLSETTRSAGQKRAQPATTSAGAGEEPQPKRRRGARKKVRSEEEIATRRENYLQRNRDAAQKCRQKKKLTEAKKREQMAKERHDNHIIWNQVVAVQDELESLRNFILDIESHCQSSNHKTDQIDMCNQRRAQIFQGLVMQRSFGGYAQQDSMQDGPGSTQDGQSPTMSSRNSISYSEQMLSPRSTRGSSYATRQLNTDSADGNELTRKGSNDSSTQPDSAVDVNSPPGTKDLPVEDEAIEIQVHEEEEFLPLRALRGNNANALSAFLTHM
ncbi:hypothetical protein DL95DRAFT_451482 [Leptodontidium sp. 2 PMI_412]|nr:hypothetical protein DL95DRAFT_451482 [Leptodontidium sp. 2 PMI_412]